MKLLDEYIKEGIILLPKGKQHYFEILTDSEDEFSVRYYNRHGEPVIMGVQRNTEIFWRNRPDAEGI